MVFRFVQSGPSTPDRKGGSSKRGRKMPPEVVPDTEIHSHFSDLEARLIAQSGLKKCRRVYEDGRRVQYADSVYLSSPRHELIRTPGGSIVTYRVAVKNTNIPRSIYGPRDESLMDKFMRRVEKNDDGHWYWTGHIDEQGYGRFSVKIDGKYKTVGAHRWIFETMVRPLEPDEVPDHRNDICGIRNCVNYEDGHLEAVTNAENARRGRVKLSLRNFTVCTKGHVLADVGTRVDQKGTVLCAECQRENVKRCAAGYFDRRVEHCVQLGIDGVFCENGHNLELPNSLGSRGSCKECHRLTEQARRDRLKS